jgi:adenosine kinase
MAHAGELAIRDELRRGPIDLVVISPTDPGAMVAYVRECKELGLPYIYDPSQQIIRLNSEELAEGVRGSTMTIVNEYEFEMLKNKTGWSEAQVSAATQVLVVTCGERGSEVRVEGERYCISAVSATRQADPTGVGDAYRAGLIKGYLKGMPWTMAGQVGSLAATYALEEHGTQNHHYTLEEFTGRFEKAFGTKPLL